MVGSISISLNQVECCNRMENII